MNTVGSAALTAAIVTMGRWAQGKKLDTHVFVGAAVYMVGLSLLSQANSDLSSKFALLVLVSAFLYYGVSVMRKLGLIK